jgi:hypothetical protein
MKNFSLILISTLFVNLLCAQKSITREEAIAMVKKDFYAFESLDQKYQSDKEIFSLAMKMCNDAMKFASQDLKKNKGFVTRALKVDERTLKYADEFLMTSIIVDWNGIETVKGRKGITGRISCF